MPESPWALVDAMTWDLPNWTQARDVPTLALQGDRDAFIPTSDLGQIALSYGAETELLHGLGHGAPIDPGWETLARRIAAWLAARFPSVPAG
jgi:pimeloyl-ACP methyl ester carboxylesterase